MRQFFTRLLAPILMSAAMLTPVHAQDFPSQDDSMGARIEDEGKPDKKHPSFWHRPAMANASEQLAHAEKLLAEGRTGKAMKQYNALVHRWGQSPEAPEAQLKYAQLLEARGKQGSAFEEYQYLIEYYSGRFDYRDVIDRQFRLANTLRTTRRGRLTLFNKIVLCPGFLAPERAIPMFEQVVENAPTWERAAEAQYLIGVIHQDLADYDEASLAFEIFQRRYRNSPRAEDAAFRDGECLCMSVRQRPRNEQSYRLALAALAGFIRDYPRSERLADAQKHLNEMKARLSAMYYERATYYDAIAHRPKSAIIAYKDFIKHFPTSDLAVQANGRIKELEQLVENRMKNTTRSLVALITVTCLFSASGCAGYRLGSSLPEGIQKVYVPTFVNKCGEPLIENDTTRYTIAEIQKDGTLEIASDFADADAELSVTITQYAHEAIRFDRDNPKQADEYRLKLTADILFEQIRPERKVLVKRTVVGEGTFVSSGDMASAKRAALPKTSADLAHRIVESVAENW